MYTSGAIILTNDGDFVYKITHPKHEITKTYTVTLTGIVSDEEIKAYEAKFLEAINDDLNMPVAMSVVWEIIKNPKKSKKLQELLLKFDEVLGFDLKNYQKEEKYDSKLTIGTKYVDQKGKKGLQRVSQDVRKVNGAISSAVPVNTVILKKAQNEITLVGTKEVPTVGSLGSWYWPTNQGYRISSYFGYRKNPFGSGRELHTGLDIAGTGYGSPVYASNNGVVMTVKSLNYSYGKHIIINHNNGYYTLYGHMSRFAKGIREGATVSRGQIIGYVGDTGAATGPHLHFEIHDCGKYYGCFLNPLPFLRK